MSTTISPLNQHAFQTIQTTEYGPTTSSMDDISDPFAAGLTPDALMVYCQSRLDGIDGQVRASFDAQQRGASDIAKINEISDNLKAVSSVGVNGSADCTKLENSLGSSIADLQASDPNCPALPGLIQTYNNMVWSGTGGSTGPQFIDPKNYPPDTSLPKQGDEDLGTTELQGYAQNVSDAAAAINSNSELEMVHLQSLMSQRQTAISLTTNLVQSLGDQETKIAENIGH